MNQFKLFEGLRAGDLEYVVSPYVSIDQYTAKLNDDNIVIAFFCNEREVANDLYLFLEKLYVIEIKDIEISDSLTEDNKYILFVEVDRNQKFPELLLDIIDSINFLINKEVKDWDFVTFGMKKKDTVSIENIRKSVRLTHLEAPIEEDKMKQEMKQEIKQESIEYSMDGFSKKFIDEGYISERKMIKILESCEDFNEDTLEKELVEYNNPGAEIITADEHCFIIGDKIRKLRMM